MNLSKLLQFFYGNQSAVARLLGINRGTLRTDINKGKDFIVVSDTVYKSVGKIDTSWLKKEAKERLDEELVKHEFLRDCGEA